MIDEFFVRMMTELIEGMRTRAGQGARCMHVCVNLSSAAIGRSATRNGHLLLYFLFSLFNHLNMTRSGGSFMLLLIFSFFIVFFGLIQAQDIPQKFFGAFQLDHSDNWDAYLAAKGYDEQTRKTVKLPKITRILFPKEPGVYRMMVGTGLEGSRWVKGSKKNADWSFRLGSQFQAKYWDGNQHLILFTYDPTSDRLTERHTVVGSQAAPESFVYNINAEGNLDSHIMFNGVELIHHYIRTD